MHFAVSPTHPPPSASSQVLKLPMLAMRLTGMDYGHGWTLRGWLDRPPVYAVIGMPREETTAPARLLP